MIKLKSVGIRPAKDEGEQASRAFNIKRINSYEKDGVLHGVEKRWYSNGQLMAEINYSHGVIEDVVSLFDEEGMSIDKNQISDFFSNSKFTH